MSEKPHCVVLTGAGISAESGLKTFRAEDGLWENYSIEEVATPAGWAHDPELVLRFYNERRRQVRKAEPNRAHLELVRLTAKWRVSIITQNIDDLHERAFAQRGAEQQASVLHLHGEITKVCSSANPHLIYPADNDTRLGDSCELGSQLRPFVVWFGEEVPLIPRAVQIVRSATVLLVIGTSLSVYPAADLINEAPHAPLYFVDPAAPVDTALSRVPFSRTENSGAGERSVRVIRKPATVGVSEVVAELLGSA